MAHVVVVEKNKDGKIELTKNELQKMLDNAYNDGYSEGVKHRYDTISYPSYPVWYTTAGTTATNKESITIKGTDVTL